MVEPRSRDRTLAAKEAGKVIRWCWFSIRVEGDLCFRKLKVLQTQEGRSDIDSLRDQ